MIRLISAVIFLQLTLIGLPAFAQQYGYIRVEVDQNPTPPKEHKWLIQLHSNGAEMGKPFAHASKGFEWKALHAQNLSSNSRQTPMSASYGNLSANGCSFTFEIFFSFTPNGNGISLGRFNAPFDTSIGTLPIGLHCPGASIAVCSTNTAINNQLIKMEQQKRVEAYNQWKKDYDERIRNEQKALAEQQATIDAALDAKAGLDESSEPTPEEMEAEAAAQELEAENQANHEAEVELLKLAGVDEVTNAVALAENAGPSIDQILQDRFQENMEAHREELAKTPLGTFLSMWNDLMRMVEETIDAHDRNVKYLKEAQASREEILEAEMIAAQMKWGAYTLSTTGPLMEGLKAGIKLAAGDLGDACEAASGLKNCTGRELTTKERLMAAAGVAWGNREIFTQMEKQLGEKLAGDAKDIVEALNDMNAELETGPYMAELIIDGYVEGNGKIVSSVLKRMNSGEVSAQPYTLSLESGDRVVIRPNGNDKSQWIFDVQAPGTNPGEFETSYSLEVTLNSEGRIKAVK